MRNGMAWRHHVDSITVLRCMFRSHSRKFGTLSCCQDKAGLVFSSEKIGREAKSVLILHDIRLNNLFAICSQFSCKFDMHSFPFISCLRSGLDLLSTKWPEIPVSVFLKKRWCSMKRLVRDRHPRPHHKGATVHISIVFLQRSCLVSLQRDVKENNGVVHCRIGIFYSMFVINIEWDLL